MSCLIKYRSGRTVVGKFIAYRGDKVIVKVDGRIYAFPTRDLIEIV